MGHRQEKLIYRCLLESRLCVLYNYLWILKKKSHPLPRLETGVAGLCLGWPGLEWCPSRPHVSVRSSPRAAARCPMEAVLPCYLISCLRHCLTAFVTVGLTAKCGWSQNHLCGFPAQPRRISLEGYLSHQGSPCCCPFLWRCRLI